MLATKILIAYNGTDLADQAVQLAKKVVEGYEQIVIDLLYIVQTPSTLVQFAGASQVCESSMEQLIQDGEAILHQGKRLFADLPNKVETHIAHGDATTEIIQHIEDSHIDLLIMGSRGLKGVKEKMSSVSHRVLQQSPIPVLMAK